MPSIDDEPEEPDDIDADREGPDPSDIDYSDEADLEVCPHCRKMIYEDTEQCPHCGQYISLESAPLGRRSWIVIGIIFVLVLVMLYWAI